LLRFGGSLQLLMQGSSYDICIQGFRLDSLLVRRREQKAEAFFQSVYQKKGIETENLSRKLILYLLMALVLTSCNHVVSQTIEIVSVEPCTVWSQQHGVPPRPDSDGSKCFAVEVRAWGEDRMSGSAVSGDLQLLFLTLVLENDEWKIDSFATALLH
jgi:hypothetical protein